ncbi:MAG: HTH-type transcriptional regulator CysB [Gammaproteobacteria bacterium]|nr:HTH-type transcriptional regulator CysB [Gammaproteobacteria bacterium]
MKMLQTEAFIRIGYMKLRQLEYLTEVVRQGLNVTAAAEILHTSQPGISSQIKLLEEELGFPLFVRQGRHLAALTDAGQDVLTHATRMLDERENIKRVAREVNAPSHGSFSIATTHTQARYALPDVISRFATKYPNVSLHIQQGTPTQIAEMTVNGEADLAIATEALELFEDLVLMPCYRWNRCVVVPKNHKLAGCESLTMELIAQYPVITYIFSIADRSVINQAFKQVGLDMKVVLTATDAEVIKAYVQRGLGIGIIARMAFDRAHDHSLVALDAGHLFQHSVTSMAVRRNVWLRGYIYDFIQWFAPHLDRNMVETFMTSLDREETTRLFQKQAMRAEMR